MVEDGSRVRFARRKDSRRRLNERRLSVYFCGWAVGHSVAELYRGRIDGSVVIS